MWTILCFRFSRNEEEIRKDLEKFLERVVKFNLKLAPKKTNLRVKQLICFRHNVTAEGVWPDPEKVMPVLNLHMPCLECERFGVPIGCIACRIRIIRIFGRACLRR